MTGRELIMTPTREALERLRLIAKGDPEGLRDLRETASLALGLLDRVAKVLEPFVVAWDEEGPQDKSPGADGMEWELGSRLTYGDFRNAASLYADLGGEDA